MLFPEKTAFGGDNAQPLLDVPVEATSKAAADVLLKIGIERDWTHSHLFFWHSKTITDRYLQAVVLGCVYYTVLGMLECINTVKLWTDNSYIRRVSDSGQI
eukprot:TRINITY_DN6665_c0_g1_i1.p1 TRINITY_DN6665_c0_g1~~TRINITY_DN6665_c0_g1_i1.p1  ORF type:complete len:101 (-),score=8.23 TRINITY_DN6665_c0_g1_i1:340-642(-)